MLDRQVDPRIALALIGAVIMAVGSVGPWVTALGGTLGYNGTAGDGNITLICAIACGVAVVIAADGLPVGIVAVLAAIVGGGVGLYDLVHISNVIGGSPLVQVGWGLYAVVVGGVLSTIGTIGARQRLGRPSEPAAPAPHPFT